MFLLQYLCFYKKLWHNMFDLSKYKKLYSKLNLFTIF
jgi:hypothetical protein